MRATVRVIEALLITIACHLARTAYYTAGGWVLWSTSVVWPVALWMASWPLLFGQIPFWVDRYWIAGGWLSVAIVVVWSLAMKRLMDRQWTHWCDVRSAKYARLSVDVTVIEPVIRPALILLRHEVRVLAGQATAAAITTAAGKVRDIRDRRAPVVIEATVTDLPREIAA